MSAAVARRRPGPSAATKPDVPEQPESVPFVARITGWVLAISGAIGFLAAFTLIAEKIALIKDPGYTPSCSINPLLSCGSVMSTEQAEVFGSSTR